VTSRLPIGVVNLLRGQPPPQGPSLRQAYLPVTLACALALAVPGALCTWAARTRRWAGPLVLLLTALALVVALRVWDLSATMLWAFAPDIALVVAAALVLLCLPAALRAGAWARRSMVGQRNAVPT
jgi:hypothetical protein